MTMTAELMKVEQENLLQVLHELSGNLDGVDGEVELDFSAVRRVDATSLIAIEMLANVADEKSVKVTLRDVNVDVYRVLKLMKLTRRFTFAN